MIYTFKHESYKHLIQSLLLHHQRHSQEKSSVQSLLP